MVSTVCLLFGATGTIYDSTRARLVGLGVPLQTATRTLAAVHTTLCKHVHAIVGARRAREHNPPAA